MGEDIMIKPEFHQPCGLNEATWGRPQQLLESDDEQTKETERKLWGEPHGDQTTDFSVPVSAVEENVTPIMVEPTGLRECTWGKPQAEDRPSVQRPGGGDESELTTDKEFDGNAGTGLQEAMMGHEFSSESDFQYEDVYGSNLTDFPATRIMIPTALTPIPEVSEYSILTSSRGSLRFPRSWDSEELSHPGSTESRPSCLVRVSQQLRPSSDRQSSPEHDTSTSGSRAHETSVSDSDPQKRLSFGSSVPSEAGGVEPVGGSLHTKTSSSHSSLLDFIRLENSLEGSRTDLSEEERQLLLGQHDTSLRDIVSSIHALQRQYTDETAESIPPISGGSSSGSHLTSASTEAERRLGAVNQDMLRQSEHDPPGSIVASLMAAQLQQLIQSVSTNSSSVSSPPTSTSANGTGNSSTSLNPVGDPSSKTS